MYLPLGSDLSGVSLGCARGVGDRAVVLLSVTCPTPRSLPLRAEGFAGSAALNGFVATP